MTSIAGAAHGVSALLRHKSGIAKPLCRMMMMVIVTMQNIIVMMLMMMMMPMDALVVLLKFCKGTPSSNAEFHLRWIVAPEIRDFVQKTRDFYFAIFHISPWLTGRSLLCRICKKFGGNHLILWFFGHLTKKVLGENLCNCKDDFSMKFWLFSVVERWGHLLKLWLEKRRENWGEKWERQWGRRCHQRERRRKLRRQRTMRKKIPPKRKDEKIEKKKNRWQGGQWGEAAGWKLGDFLSKSSFRKELTLEKRRKVITRVISWHRVAQDGISWNCWHWLTAEGLCLCCWYV